jgi:hypothetical protein
MESLSMAAIILHSTNPIIPEDEEDIYQYSHKLKAQVRQLEA